MVLTKDNLNEALADAVMDRPREFFIDNRRFCLWSPSLGMSMMLSRHIKSLGINHAILENNAAFETLRVTKKEKKKVCCVLSIHSFRRYRDLCNSQTINNRADYFYSKLDDETVASLLLVILSEPMPETLISLCGISEQQERQAIIAKIKKDTAHTISFGGLTIYGSLISAAMSAFHMTFWDVVWGISLVNLRMLLADNVSSVYLSDEEAQKLGFESESKEKYGMTPEDMAKLRSMDWT